MILSTLSEPVNDQLILYEFPSIRGPARARSPRTGEAFGLRLSFLALFLPSHPTGLPFAICQFAINFNLRRGPIPRRSVFAICHVQFAISGPRPGLRRLPRSLSLSHRMGPR